MAPTMRVTFLGTTSGGGPTETRNCSSLVLDAVGDNSLWMFDCAEGTVRQFAQQIYPSHDPRRVKISKITKVFITHMHADHTMGLITILRNVLGMPTSWDHSHEPQPREYMRPSVEIYGPAGLRSFVRTNFNLTHTRSARHYCVHELLHLRETPSAVCNPHDLMHPNEELGKDIFPDENGFWTDICEEFVQRSGRVTVDAGPIEHRDPCIGYVVRERPQQSRERPELFHGPWSYIVPRTIVILGDTSDPSAMIPLIRNKYDDPVSLLIHEATDAWMPPHIDKYGTTGKNRTEQSVREKAIQKGHSTPAMAGKFAHDIKAQLLILNHIGSRFPAPAPGPKSAGEWFRHNCMRELERQANVTWKPPLGASAIAAFDFLFLDIPPNRPTYEAADMQPGQSDVKMEIEETNRAFALGAGGSSQAATVAHAHYERREHTSNTEPSRGKESKKRHRRRGNDDRRSPSGSRSRNDERQSSRGRPHGHERQNQDRPRSHHRPKSEHKEKSNHDSSFEEGQFKPEKRIKQEDFDF